MTLKSQTPDLTITLSTSALAVVNPGLTMDVEIVNLVSDVAGTDTFAAGTANVANFAGVTHLNQNGGSQAVTKASEPELIER